MNPANGLDGELSRRLAALREQGLYRELRRMDSPQSARIQIDGVDLEAVFIRAPIIRRVGPAATVLATYQNDPVLVGQGRHLVATFHPELTSDVRVHHLFLEKL